MRMRLRSKDGGMSASSCSESWLSKFRGFNNCLNRSSLASRARVFESVNPEPQNLWRAEASYHAVAPVL